MTHWRTHHALKDLKLTGEQVRALSREQLAALPDVKKELQAAAGQAQRYGAALQERYGLTDLRLFAVVGIGLERVVWQNAPPSSPPSAAKEIRRGLIGDGSIRI